MLTYNFYIWFFVILGYYILYLWCGYSCKQSNLSLLTKLFEEFGFVDDRVIAYEGDFVIIQANYGIDKYLFGLHRENKLNIENIELLYKKSIELNINKVVVVSKRKIRNSSRISKKINEYSFEIWDKKKIDDIIKNENNLS